MGREIADMKIAKRSSPRQGGPDPVLLRRVVRRIVKAVRPKQIILFGSAARGNMGPHSDLDLLVVKRTTQRNRLAQRALAALRGTGIGADILAASPGDLERHRHNPGLIIGTILREGRVIYGV